MLDALLQMQKMGILLVAGPTQLCSAQKERKSKKVFYWCYTNTLSEVNVITRKIKDPKIK